MQRKPTLSERILLIAASIVSGVWCLLVITIALGFSGRSTTSTWAVRAVLLSVGILVTSGCASAAVRGWRRAVSQPLRGGRASLWIARQPGWRLAFGIWLLYSAPELGTGLWVSYRDHQGVATMLLWAGLPSSVVAASLLALLFRVLWRRQAENGVVSRAAPARGAAVLPTPWR